MDRVIYNRIVLVLFALTTSLLLILLSSCYPEFRNPIPLPSELKTDNSLLGTWERTTSSSREQISLSARRNGWFDLVYIYDINSKTSSDGINVLTFEGYKTDVNKNNFLCLRFREKDCPKQNVFDINQAYFIVNYEIKNGDLILKPFWSEAVKNLIEKEKLAGIVKKADLFNGQSYDRVIITESSENLYNYIAKHGIGEFLGEGEHALMTFSRMKN